MVKLGTRVRVRGREGMVVARTLSADTLYDVRFKDGSVVKYVPAAEFDLVGNVEIQTYASA